MGGNAPVSRVLPPPKVPPRLTPAKTKGSVALVENSQSQAPKPSKRDPKESSEGAPKLKLASKSKAGPSCKEPAPETKVEEAQSAEVSKAATEATRESSSPTPSAKEEEKRRRRRREKEKEKEKRRKRPRSSSRSSSVTGPRVRESKKKERKARPLTPPRPKSPHTPPGPPPPPAPPPAPPAAPQRGWVGPIPWSNHPRWYVGKNKGVTRRAKQELLRRG